MDPSSPTATDLISSSFEELDPSLVGGYSLVYEREVPIELRVAELHEVPQDVGSLEAIRVKVLVQGEVTSPSAVQMELSSEANLFFNFAHRMSEAEFHEAQARQKLMVDFATYADILTKTLTNCIHEPQHYLAVLVMSPSGQARLDFIQNLEYKFIELLSCRCAALEEEVVRQHVAFRYNQLKQKAALLQARLSDMNAVIKSKNPSLLLQMRPQNPRVLASTKPASQGSANPHHATPSTPSHKGTRP